VYCKTFPNFRDLVYGYYLHQLWLYESMLLINNVEEWGKWEKNIQMKYFCVCDLNPCILISFCVQGTQENVNADGRLPEQDEGHTVYEGHKRNTTCKYSANEVFSLGQVPLNK